MLKAIQLVKEVRGAWWTICPFSGRLLKYSKKPSHINTSNIPERVKRAIALCDDPFQCQSVSPTIIDISSSVQTIEKSYHILDFLIQKSFLLSLTYSSFEMGLFKTTKEAMAAVLQIPSTQNEQYQLCLPIALMSIKLSKSFKKNGVLMIGAFIPTGEMHAWIMENGSQVNFEDRQWINFQPLLAYIKE